MAAKKPPKAERHKIVIKCKYLNYFGDYGRYCKEEILAAYQGPEMQLMRDVDLEPPKITREQGTLSITLNVYKGGIYMIAELGFLRLQNGASDYDNRNRGKLGELEVHFPEGYNENDAENAILDLIKNNKIKIKNFKIGNQQYDVVPRFFGLLGKKIQKSTAAPVASESKAMAEHAEVKKLKMYNKDLNNHLYSLLNNDPYNLFNDDPYNLNEDLQLPLSEHLHHLLHSVHKWQQLDMQVINRNRNLQNLDNLKNSGFQLQKLKLTLTQENSG